VGSTTVALQLATELAVRKLRVVLVDADLERADASRRAGIGDDADGYLTDVLAGRRTAVEVLENGPAGIRVLAGKPHHPAPPAMTLSTRNRLPHELRHLAGRSDLVIVDTPGGLTPWSERFWLAAKLVLAVTTPDDAAIMDTYAMLKSASHGGPLPGVRIVVNRCDSPQQADHVHQRIGQACYRFLGELVPAMPPLPAVQLPATDFVHTASWHSRSPRDSNYLQYLRKLADEVVNETVAAKRSQLAA
jgi:MinD-like ATPase involved in chromosome partitioning or flagellar assembly